MPDGSQTYPALASDAAEGAPGLAVRGLRFEIGGRRLIDIAALHLQAAGPTVIVGPNGAGKSLLLRLMHGLIPASAGEILWQGRPVGPGSRPREAMVFQRPVLLRRSVAANLDYVLRRQGMSRAARPARIAALLAEAGLSGRERQPARSLSGGEQQRLALARALATRPQLLFLDEPTASLDPGSTHAIEGLLTAAAAAGTKLVMVSHDMGQARRLAAEVVVMHRGRVLECGPARSVLAAPGDPEAAAFLQGRLLL